MNSLGISLGHCESKSRHALEAAVGQNTDQTWQKGRDYEQRVRAKETAKFRLAAHEAMFLTKSGRISVQ